MTAQDIILQTNTILSFDVDHLGNPIELIGVYNKPTGFIYTIRLTK